MTDRAAFRQCSFDFVPPRNFLFPAVLLIVADRPCHGYGIAAQLPALGFGTTDRPAVYRTLAKLEADGLVYRSVGVRDQGDTRTVYRISPSGEERLSEWVAVMEAQQRAIGAVVARYYDEATALTAS